MINVCQACHQRCRCLRLPTSRRKFSDGFRVNLKRELIGVRFEAVNCFVLMCPHCSNLCSENQRFCEEKLHFWCNFDVFGIKFSKNRALKTFAKNLKSGSENPKP